MQYTEAIDYLYSRLPVFHRIGAKAIKPGLGNIEKLCASIGDPQQRFPSIHVAGTNGKGSTSHMLAAVYQSAGYRVGLYTSPHLKSFTERIRLNGQPIAEADVANFVEQHQDLIERVEPSFFEVTVAMAFAYFAQQTVDLAIIEVGLGGRLDSTNIITPVASVITNISFDHTDILGDTLPLIASEKAGIIKPGIPVIIGESIQETEGVFREKAASVNAPIYFAEQQYPVLDKGIQQGGRHIMVHTKQGDQIALQLDLTGVYQLRNVSTVLTTVAIVQTQFPVSWQAQEAGLKSVSQLTGLKGRFQTLHEQPKVIADTAHNPAGVEVLLQTVNTLQFTKLRIILGMVADKDRQHVLAILPKTAIYYFCQAQTPRSLPAKQLQEEAAQLGRMGTVFTDVNTALSAAVSEASQDDLILITGSNYTIAELTDL